MAQGQHRSWVLTAIAALIAGQHVQAHASHIHAAGPVEVVSHAAHRSLQSYMAGDNVSALLLEAVNAERAAANLSALCANSKLKVAAQLHTEDQATFGNLSHNGSDGSTVETRINAQGFIWTTLGENVAAGFPNISAVMAAWMNSTGHKANILNSNFTFFGGGYAYNATDNYHHYWTQDFGSGSSEVCDSNSSSGSAQTPSSATSTPTNSNATNSTATETPAPTTSVPTTSTPAGTQTPISPTPTTSAPLDSNGSSPVTPSPTPSASQGTPTPTSTATPSSTAGTNGSNSSIPLNGVCGNDAEGAKTCVNGAYCQPWTPQTYECIAVPTNSGMPEVNIAFNGTDIQVIRGLGPHECCDECTNLSGCHAYTFVNSNSDNKTACYLKSAAGAHIEKKGAISAFVTLTS